MERLKAGVFVLFVLVAQVSCSGADFFTDPVICYFLDGFLMVYCIVATALYFREKFSRVPVEMPSGEEKGGIYQELERPKDTDPYQELDPLRRKKKSGKKKKTRADDKDKDPYECLSPAPPPQM
ncbi:CD247 antigen like [Betta splendens]|uniref:CD247 antigen like n=1 Tax=Betta splendens TaxID=158456 RepID=A0A6P7LAQ1_BETSP|nr:CD247 antigen like [Betta splendens]